MKGSDETKLHAGDFQERNSHQLYSDKKLTDQKLDFLKRYYQLLNSDRYSKISDLKMRNGNTRKVPHKPNVPFERSRKLQDIHEENEIEQESSYMKPPHNLLVQTVNAEADNDCKFFENVNFLAIRKKTCAIRNFDKNCVSSLSAPAILEFSGERKNSSEMDRRKTCINDFGYVFTNSKNYITKVGTHFEPSSKTQTHVMNIENNKNLKIRGDSIRKLKRSVKYLQNRKFKANGRKAILRNSPVNSPDEREQVHESESTIGIDLFSSYSESELRARYPKVSKYKDSLENKTDPYRCSRHGLYKCTSLRCKDCNTKQKSKTLYIYRIKNEIYPVEFHQKPVNKSTSRKSESSCSTDSFMENELLNYKKFLIQQQKLQKSKTESKKFQERPYIPKTCKLEVRSSYCNQGGDCTKELPHPNRLSRSRKKKITDEELLKRFATIFRSDEAHFWLNGYVNKQNCRIWSEANPQVYVETPLHPEKLTVWNTLWAGGIISPYFFKNDEGVTVNGDRYRAMITNFFIPELNNHDVQELWFQQDGATCHTARAIIDLWKDTFGDRLISRFGPVNWPRRSCDLTPPDYFLWGYVKSLVYADKPQMLDHLEDNIRRVIADIRPQMLEKVIENWTSRLDSIRASRGSPMPEIIFKM
ncbi:uncharacterized protein TNCV_817971 [Trichonephila clavipes]|nr:uncharacterized protein TNCV_817971 [Trichonephila clavipes]